MLKCSYRTLSIALAIALISNTAAYAENIAAPKGVVAGASVEGISEYTLANGMKVLLFPDASKATTTVNVTYNVGSLHENYGETGMAHLLEHMMFKGTPNNSDITADMKKRGMSYNASTWLDRTNYFETFSADPAQLSWALKLEADRMINSFVARKDLDSEMTVVRNEMESGENSPISVLLERMMATSYLWHNYGKSTIGARADVENVSIERLQAFYRNYYQPDNAVILIAGRFDAAATLAQIDETFGKIKKPARVLPKLYTTEPVQDGEREIVVRRVGDTQLAGVVYHMPPASHADAAAMAVLSNILGDTPSGRLHKALVETKQATSVFGFNFELREPGTSLYMAQLPLTADARQVSTALIGQVEGLGGKPVTAAEVDRAKNALLKSYDVVLNDANRLGTEMSESIAAGDWRLFFIGRDRIKAITADDVNRVATAYLKPSNRTLGLFLPDAKPNRADIPAAPDVAALVKDYKGDAAIAAGETFDPSPTNIESRTERGQFKFGAKYALLTKKTRGETVRGVISLHFGDVKTLKNTKTAAEMAGAMLMYGTPTMTREQIANTLDKLKATVSIGGDADSARVTILTTRANLPTVMALVQDLLRNSSFPESEFEQLRAQSISGIEAQQSEPEAIASTELSRHFNTFAKDDPRYVDSFAESIAALKAVTLTQVKSFHKDFYGIEHAELSFVGDFDSAALKTQANTLFADWKSSKPYARLENPYQAVATADKTFEAPDKANALVLMRQGFAMNQDAADYPAMVIGNYILGGGSLKSRIADRIRQKEGLSYGAGSQFDAGVIDANAYLFGYAITAPENAAKVETAFREEIARIVKDGVTEVEVTDAIAGYLKARESRRNEDAGVANSLGDQAFYGFTMQRVIDLEANIKKLDVAKVNAALRANLKPEALSFFAAGDFAKAAKAVPAAAPAK
ncbi:MAG: pitrilysin family protein [Arenimonas sp.]